MKQFKFTSLIIAFFLLLAVQGNAHDVQSTSEADRIQQEEMVTDTLLVEELGACGANYGCTVTEIASSNAVNHDDLLADLANSLGQDD